jgi:hypothetical protein
MLKAYALRFHRWSALLFALPLLMVIGTGLVLSFEPLAQQTGVARPLPAADVLGWLDRHDPAGKATALSIRPYEGLMAISGSVGEIRIDLATGAPVARAGLAWSDIFRTSRRLHETLLLDLGWLVTASTIAMLAISFLGLLMGLPRLRQTLGGWHAGAAWGALPLVILSPLTGLALAFGITFAPASGPRAAPVALRAAVETVAGRHDLARLTSLRSRGGRMIARVATDDGLTSLVVTQAGLAPAPRNWPRALHEGNWSPWLAPVLNILVSLVFVGLWATGLLIWLRRSLRLRQKRLQATLRPSPQG